MAIEIFDIYGRTWTGQGWRDSEGRVWRGLDETGRPKRYIRDVVCPGCRRPYGDDREHASRYRDGGTC